MVKLTEREEDLFRRVSRTGEWDLFTERYFRLPFSGTWFTTEDRVERYEVLYDIWQEMGKPGESFEVVLDGEPTTFKVGWDTYYDGYPMFLLPHGFRTMPWMRGFLDLSTSKAIAITGTGSGKTCGVAIRALTYCALYPGFKVLNIAPKQVQAELALNEIEKWAGNTEFSKFIRKSRGANPLWKEKPYPTITVEVVDGHPSTLTCQTVGQDAASVLGGEYDWINADEAQLLQNIEEAQPVLATRLRGTRSTGLPRSTKLTWITNPGMNPELFSLMEQYEKLRDDGDTSVVVLEGIDTSDNIYLTERQKEEQEKLMTENSRERWHGGKMSSVVVNSEIGEGLVVKCEDQRLTNWARKHGRYIDGLGIMQYERPVDYNRHYIAFGDAGKSRITAMSSMNIPCVGVIDVTNFLREPMELAAFYWFDGQGDYSAFVDKMKHAMTRYQARGFYDATNVQTAFEDLDETFRYMDTTPVYFSGHAGTKRWAITMLIRLMGDEQFLWPKLKCLRYQARIFKASSNKQADDVIATLLVFCLALRTENTFWNRLVEHYKMDPNQGLITPRHQKESDGAIYREDRYDRIPL